jgi:hypothetical protein
LDAEILAEILLQWVGVSREREAAGFISQNAQVN